MKRTIGQARQLEIEANFYDQRAAEVAEALLTREQLARAWRQAAAIQRQQAAEIRAQLRRRQAA